MRIKNDLEFQIGRYQSRVTCFDIIQTEALADVWMSKHVARGIFVHILLTRAHGGIMIVYTDLHKEEQEQVNSNVNNVNNTIVYHFYCVLTTNTSLCYTYTGLKKFR